MTKDNLGQLYADMFGPNPGKSHEPKEISSDGFYKAMDEFNKSHPKSGIHVENGANIFYEDGKPIAILGDDMVTQINESLKDHFRQVLPLLGDEQKEINQ